MLAPGASLPAVPETDHYILPAIPYVNRVVAIGCRDSITGTVSYSSGFVVGPNKVWTAAHVVDSNSGFRDAGSLTVVGGANFNTPISSTSVTSYVVHDSWGAGGHPDMLAGTAFDGAILTTAGTFDGPFFEMSTLPVAIPNGSILTCVGFGRATLSSGEYSDDGFLRAFQMRAVTPSSSFSDALYGAGSGSNFTSTNPGAASSGDSGAIVLYNGKPVGYLVAGSSPRSTFTDTTTSTAQAFFRANVPGPAQPALACTVTPTTAQLNFTNLVPSREYRIMRSAALATWEEAHRFTATTATGTWSEPLAPDGRRFYRLEWNE